MKLQDYREQVVGVVKKTGRKSVQVGNDSIFLFDKPGNVLLLQNEDSTDEDDVGKKWKKREMKRRPGRHTDHCGYFRQSNRKHY
mmetsp:Transcript_19914/g.34273  ORF Transcript_19914/g.34273 Transcript_19914/m.34273 type:complete len:84 (+) Transcript_19914:184-435(+)